MLASSDLCQHYTVALTCTQAASNAACVALSHAPLPQQHTFKLAHTMHANNCSIPNGSGVQSLQQPRCGHKPTNAAAVHIATDRAASHTVLF